MVQLSSIGLPVLENRRLTSYKLFDSMRRLSTGQRINGPGDDPTDYGISENLRSQIRNTDMARRNVENMADLIRTTDAWLQVGNDITMRMSQLATSAIDASKTDSDRDKLNQEYLQLKEELSRLSGSARFNSLQIAGRDQMLTYDVDEETFVFSQPDGGERYNLNVKVLSGLSSQNNQDFLFDATKEYTLSGDGRSIFYVDSNDNLTRYNIEEGTLERDTADSETKGIDVDEKGRLWYATETATGSGVYSLRQQDLSSWVQDTSMLSNTAIADMNSTEFSVYEDRVYYQRTGGDIVSRNLNNLTDVKVELDSTVFSLTTTAGQFKISEQGLYIADVPTAGTVRVINMETLKADQFATGAASITDLTMSMDANLIAFNDSTDRKIYTIALHSGDQPEMTDLVQVHRAEGTTGFRGLSLDGSSHRSNFRVHNGPEANQEVLFEGADIRLFNLGLVRTDVSSIDDAKEALKSSKNARELINVQRALIGATDSRLSFTYTSLRAYSDTLGMTESRIRDTDIATEVAEMTNERVKFDATNTLILDANSLVQSALQLLQGR